MITKNNLILRDLDILKELAAMDLVHVAVSITSLDETLRLQLEPRTTTAKNRLKVIETLSKNNIPTMVMVAPIIPGLNSHEIPAIVAAADGIYDLLMSDIGLPDGRGDELMMILRKNGFDAPAIALSGYGMEADLLRSRKA